MLRFGGRTITLNARLNRQIVLAEAPSGPLGVHHFTSVTTAIPPLSPDQVLIRVVYAQGAPAARAVTTNTTAFPLTRPGDGIFTAVSARWSTDRRPAPQPGRS